MCGYPGFANFAGTLSREQKRALRADLKARNKQIEKAIRLLSPKPRRKRKLASLHVLKGGRGDAA